MRRLVVSIPTRNRPDRILNAISRNWQLTNSRDTIIFVAVDDDDQPTITALQERTWPRNVHISIEPREDSIAAKWNRALKIPASIYLGIGDDDPIVTQDYDIKILEAADRFPDGIGAVYGHLANLSFTGMPALTRGLCDKLGHIFPEYFPYWFCDHWTDTIARLIGRIAFADVRTDQSNVGKTQEMREPAWWATWFDAAYLIRRQIAHQIIKSEDFEEPQWRKKILLTHHPIHEYRDRLINEGLRQQSRQLEAWSGLKTQDDRYKRIKNSAVALIPQLLKGMDPMEAQFYRNQLMPPTEITNLRRAFA